MSVVGYVIPACIILSLLWRDAPAACFSNTDYAVFADSTLRLSWVTYTNANRVKHKREYVSKVMVIARAVTAS
jgi:hypothetical protein